MYLKIFNFYYPFRNIVFFIGEVLLIFLCVLAVSYLKISVLDADIFLWEEVLLKNFFITSVFVFSLYYLDMYNFNRVFDHLELVLKVIQGLGMVCFALVALYFLNPDLVISDDIFIYSMGFIVIVVLAWRVTYNWLLRSKRLTKRVAFLGFGEIGRKIYEELMTKKDYSFEPVGYLERAEADTDLKYIRLGDIRALKKVVVENEIDIVVVALKDKRGKMPLDELVDLKLNGVRIQDAFKFYESLTGKLFVENMGPGDIIFNDGFHHNFLKRLVKRVLDISFAVFGLIISLPVLIFTAVAVKLESKGPVFYKQVRVGEKGKEFVMYKFRSMHNRAEKNIPRWAAENDPRITKVGRFIRSTRIDEIPQMLNVLKGDMSFVGPRPERPFFVERLSSEIPYYFQRHAIKPGITGWAQIKYPYGSSTKDALEKLKYDLYYIKNFSILFDLAILFETTKVVFSKKGAR